MILLPNGCKCSDLKVFPKNWKSRSADMSCDWFIYYRFYDPLYPVKQKKIKRMNKYVLREQRQAVTQALIDNELDLLHKGYNPNLSEMPEVEPDYEVHPDTPFPEAFQYVYNTIDCAKSTKDNIGTVIKYIKDAAIKLRLAHTPIKELSRRHLRRLLNYIQEKRGFGPKTFNHYRSYVKILIDMLCEMEAIEHDPTHKLKKKKEVKQKIVVLSDVERNVVNDHLYKVDYNYWRFMQIFFHSGGRITELFNTQVRDVDIRRQRYKVLIKKGAEYRVEWKTIKDIALPFWREQLIDATPDDYVFSLDFKPGPRKVWAQMPTRRWKKLIKDNKKLKDEQGNSVRITANFYHLKHLNTTEVAGNLSQAEAARLNSHTSTAMVVSIYDVNHEERMHERLKKVDNPFAK